MITVTIFERTCIYLMKINLDSMGDLEMGSGERDVSTDKIFDYLASSSRWKEMTIGQFGPAIAEACIMCVENLIHLLTNALAERESKIHPDIVQWCQVLWSGLGPAITSDRKSVV